MSPKRKKVEAALKNLFSNPSSPKPKQDPAGDLTDQPVQQPSNSEETLVEKTVTKTPLTRQKAVAKKSPAAVKKQQVKEAKLEKNNSEEQKAEVVNNPESFPESRDKTVPASSDVPASQPERFHAEPAAAQTAVDVDLVDQPQQHAKPAQDRKQIAAETQLVVFKLDHEYYGVDIALVESIIKLQAYTVVPHTPNYIVGVTNLRGYVLPIVDLRTRFDLPVLAETQDTRIVVLLINGEKVGMIVDQVNEVARVLNQDIDPTPALIVNINMEFVDGIAKLRDENNEIVRMAILLNMEKALKIK